MKKTGQYLKQLQKKQLPQKVSLTLTFPLFDACERCFRAGESKTETPRAVSEKPKRGPSFPDPRSWTDLTERDDCEVVKHKKDFALHGEEDPLVFGVS